MLARLARQLGPGRLDLAEDAVTRALVAAARLWRIRGLPNDPAAGLYRIAWNKAADLLREQPGEAEPLCGAGIAAWPSARRGLDDDLLSLVFLCSHPALPEAARATLMLKAVLGFGVAEIGVSLRDTDMAVAERLSQGRRTIRERGLPLELPSGRALLPRLNGVLATIHLAFSEAYATARGERAVRAEICTELVRLARGLADHPLTETPTAHALAALMPLQAARLPAIDDAGEIALLADLDRRQWDRHLIAIGLHHLERAASGGTLSAYHLEAGIAAEHAVAPSHAATDWPAIRGYYDALVRLRPTPLVRLNRAVAVAETDGPAAGLQALAGLQSEPRLAADPYLSAAAAEFLARLGQREAAAEAFGRAIMLARTLPERRLLQRRLDALAMPAASL
ncbi:RNA polymerase sigma factor [Desertibaculum subflavum]|uniref:RNA polymerase sigma factor n=1 Tax=Desertibaculum subflavum TaxID=2268458 RepID=UPI0013C522D5